MIIGTLKFYVMPGWGMAATFSRQFLAQREKPPVVEIRTGDGTRRNRCFILVKNLNFDLLRNNLTFCSISY